MDLEGEGWRAYGWPATERDRNKRTFAIDASGKILQAQGYWGETHPTTNARWQPHTVPE